MHLINGVLRYAVLVYAGMLSFLYAIVSAGQILGFTGLYQGNLVIPLVFVLGAFCMWLYLKEAAFFGRFLSNKSIPLSKPIRISLIAAGVLFFLVLAAVP